jgi:hypothetical protein
MIMLVVLPLQCRSPSDSVAAFSSIHPIKPNTPTFEDNTLKITDILKQLISQQLSHLINVYL